MRTRIFTLLVAFLAIAGNAVWAAEPEKPEGLTGEGTEISPYELDSKEDLEWFRNYVNEGHPEACAKLTDNIDLENEEWEPIGYKTTSGSGFNTSTTFSYLGTFDGKGYTIKGLNLASTQNKNFIGLFTAIGTYEYQILRTNPTHTPGGVVKNLTIEGSCNYQGNLKAVVGGISVYNVGEIINCTNNIDVENGSKYEQAGGICTLNIGTIQNCTNNGDISSACSGGICGSNGGKIEKCCNYGEISGVQSTARAAYTGGTSGTVFSGKESTITNCYNSGKVTSTRGASGICYIPTTFTSGTVNINNCHNYETVESTGLYVAGIVVNETPNDSEVNVSNCYYYNMEVGYLYVNGTAEVSKDAPGVCESKTETEFVDGTVLYLLQSGNPGDDKVWEQTIGTDKYPVFDASSTPSVVYQVTVQPNDAAMGTTTGGGIFQAGTEITATATPNEGYEFINWTIGEEEQSTEATYIFNVTESITLIANFQKIDEGGEEEPGDDQDTDKPGTIVKPIKYYNIYIDTICPGLNVEVSKDVVQEGHQVSAYLTIQAECDTTGMRFEYKRSLFGYWQDLKALEGVQPGEYIIKNIYTDIYIRALDATLPEEEPTGIEDLEGVKAYAKNGSIYVYTPNREEVTIISMSGAIIKHAEQVGLQSYNVSRGIYIVRIGEKVFKLKN